MMVRQLTDSLWQYGDPPTGQGLAFVLAPFAGGSAYSLADWLPHLRGDGETALILQYPGRGPRTMDQPAETLTELADQATDDLLTHAAGPLVLAGHSMGGLLAYEISVRLEAAGRDVDLLVASAALPPHIRRLDADRIRRMTRGEWLAEIRESGYADHAALDESELLDLVYPVLRADYLLLALHQNTGPPVSCPLLAVGGTADARVSRHDLSGWAKQTTGRFSMRMIPGGHFYYQDRLGELCQMIRRALPRRETHPAERGQPSRPTHER
jgi:surfactin synthase thioesterase subunit